MIRERRILRRCTAAVGLALLSATQSTSAARAEDRDQWQQPERVVVDLGLKAGSVVAAVGCGDGYFTFRLANSVGARGKVYAVDIDAAAIARVRQRARAAGLGNVEAVVSEPADTRLPGGVLDIAFFCDVLHEAASDVRLPLLKDVARALKPGGFLYVIDWRQSREVQFDPYYKLIPLEDLLRLGRDAGLQLDAEYHYLKYQVFLRFRKP